MDYKIKSIVLVAVLLVMMITIGFLVNINQGVTGAVVTKSIACYDNSDCDDKIVETEDLCRNPGTEYSLCVNRPRL
ncbi:MAG: hypothetical protein ABIA37_01700 [Candidatus Woesearchaeota archaeon]